MSIVVTDLTVPADSITLGQVLRNHQDVRIELTQFVPTGDSLVPYFWAETEDSSAFEEAVRSDERVATLDRLDGGHERHLYSIEWAVELDGFIEALEEHDLIVEEATGTPKRWRFRLRGPDRGNLSSFQDTLSDRGIPAEIRRVWEPSNLQGDEYGITAKQFEALELAFTEGYFDVPRDANLTDLAERLSITRQSLARRLSRGQYNLLANTIMNSP